jgi:hypothetical protein
MRGVHNLICIGGDADSPTNISKFVFGGLLVIINERVLCYQLA